MLRKVRAATEQLSTVAESADELRTEFRATMSEVRTAAGVGIVAFTLVGIVAAVALVFAAVTVRVVRDL